MRASRPLVALLALAVALPLVALPVAQGPIGDAAASPAGAATQERPCTGTVTEPADGWTVVSVQGNKFRGDDSGKTAPRLVAFGPAGQVKFVHPYGNGAVWGYDVDPMANGNLFVTTTIRSGGQGDTQVFELDPETGERAWTETFDALDTHDADLVRRNSIAVANMRNYDEEAGVNDDRLFVYNRTTDEVTTEWRFDDHYDESVGGDYEEDWTHVNDVEWLGGDRYMLSPRNFDQVVVVNTSSDEVEMQLGSYGDRDVLHRQHNPDYLVDDDGDPTIVVGDSDNNRIVEYERVDGEWERTWTVGDGQFRWPRDADRLPNGNTLITDSRNHRVVEVTPEGDIVWEVYVPWLPYDAERIGTGDESSGPTVDDMDATGAYQMSGSSGLHGSLESLEACGAHLDSFPKTSADDWPANGTDGTDDTWTGGPDDDGPVDREAVGSTGALVGGTVLAILVALALAVRYRVLE